MSKWTHREAAMRALEYVEQMSGLQKRQFVSMFIETMVDRIEASDRAIEALVESSHALRAALVCARQEG